MKTMCRKVSSMSEVFPIPEILALPDGFDGTSTGAGMGHTTHPIPIMIDDLLAAEASGDRFVFSARVDYTDIFGERRSSQAHLQILVLGVQEELSGAKVAPEDVLGFRLVTAFNLST